MPLPDNFKAAAFNAVHGTDGDTTDENAAHNRRIATVLIRCRTVLELLGPPPGDYLAPGWDYTSMMELLNDITPKETK